MAHFDSGRNPYHYLQGFQPWGFMIQTVAYFSDGVGEKPPTRKEKSIFSTNQSWIHQSHGEPWKKGPLVGCFSFDADSKVMAMSTDGRLCLLDGQHPWRACASPGGGCERTDPMMARAAKKRQGSTDAYLEPRRTVCIIYILYIYIYISYIYRYICSMHMSYISKFNLVEIFQSQDFSWVDFQ